MQDSVNSAMQAGLPGQLYGFNHDIIGRNNYSKKLDAVTITAADLLTTCTIDGTAYTANAGAAVMTKTAIAEELAGLINAGSDAVAYFTATNEYITVEALVVGTTNTVVGTTNCTVVNQIANAAAVDFGLIVCQDQVYDEVARVPQGATDITSTLKILGLTVQTQAIEQNYQSAGGNGYAINEEMSIMRKGNAWVQVEVAVTPADTPYARYTVSGTTKLGGIRNDADTAKAAIIPNARFATSAAASGYALLELNLP